MPRYAQPARLVFAARDIEHAYEIADQSASALSATGARLVPSTRLHLDPAPPRELLSAPRAGLVVSAQQAIAAAADLLEGDAAAPVQLELAGPILTVTQGDCVESYDLDGTPVEHRATPAGAERCAVTLTAAEVRRAASEAVREGGAEGVLLSRPLTPPTD